MIHYIDVSSVLRRTVSELYSDLVTRPTGAAVRAQIERQLAATPVQAIVVIDFSHVGLLDFSCADEIVAKLLLRYADDGSAASYLLFRGVTDSHLDAIEAVLEKRGLALVIELPDGDTTIVGRVEDGERHAWMALRRCGPAAPDRIALEAAVPPDEASALVERLCERRLAMRVSEGYVAVGGRA